MSLVVNTYFYVLHTDAVRNAALNIVRITEIV